jgi:hypothetical protein
VLQNPVWRSRVALSRKPFEPFENNSKGIKKELLGSFEGLTGRCEGGIGAAEREPACEVDEYAIGCSSGVEE